MEIQFNIIAGFSSRERFKAGVCIFISINKNIVSDVWL